MKYFSLTDESLHVTARLSRFKPVTGTGEYHAMLEADSTDAPFETQLQQIQLACNRFLIAQGKEIRPIFKRYFVSDIANQASLILKQELSEKQHCPFSVIQQPPLGSGKIAVWIYLQDDIEEIGQDPFSFSRNGYTHYWFSLFSSVTGGSANQTQDILNRYIHFLEQQKISLARNCVRTWFFVRNIDTDYKGVVQGRKEIFDRNGLTENTHYIASTGIGGKAFDSQASVLFDAYAVKGYSSDQIRYLYAPTHLNRTSDYGVTFERGTVVTYGDRKQIWISGTASIDNRGEIVWPGNIRKQTDRMCENVEILLKEGGATAGDIAQMIVYVRDIADSGFIRSYMEKRYPDIPKVILYAPVCRPGWLIETECIAIVGQNSDFRPL